MVYTLMVIAIFILIMAYDQLHQSIDRPKYCPFKRDRYPESIGWPETSADAKQFPTESVILSVAATLISLFFYFLFAPILSGMLEKPILSLTALPGPVWAV